MVILPEQGVNPSLTVMHEGFSDLTDTQAQSAVTGHYRAITERTAVSPQHKTDLLFADPITCLQLPNPFAQPCQRQFFFVSASCSIALSTFRSAISFFSRRFSSSITRIGFGLTVSYRRISCVIYKMGHQKYAAYGRVPAPAYTVRPASGQRQSTLR